MKEKLNVLCYSHEGFNDYMRMKGWYEKPGLGTATISICSPNDEDPVHWFPEAYLGDNINLDFDDIDPSRYWDDDAYDRLFSKFMEFDPRLSPYEIEYRFDAPTAPTGTVRAMTYEEALKIALFIDNQIKSGVKNIIIHCSAGISRSQGIVRYILDTYGDTYDIVTREDNPCITPNYHVVRMLKRVKRILK
jgi:hypothetical protein